MPPPTSLGEPITVDHTRSCFSMMSQDNITGTLSSYKMVLVLLTVVSYESKDAQVTASTPEAKKDLHRQCSGIHQSMLGLSMDEWPESPHRSRTNGTAERAVRRLQEATATAMVQCGLPDQWWDRAKECCCCLRNAYNKMADGRTTYEQRCCVKFDGPLTPFWSQGQLQAHLLGMVHQFVRKMHPGIFVGFVLRAGRGWSGDLLIVDREDFENLAPSDIHVKRFEAPWNRTRRISVVSMCRRNYSNFFDLPPSQRGEMLATETLSKLKNKKLTPFFEKVNGEDFLEHERYIYIYIYINISPHDVLRNKLYVLDETAFPFHSTASM